MNNRKTCLKINLLIEHIHISGILMGNVLTISFLQVTGAQDEEIGHRLLPRAGTSEEISVLE
jgi:hypothetical protein